MFRATQLIGFGAGAPASGATKDAPTFVSATLRQGSASNICYVDMPATVDSGDMLVMFCTKDTHHTSLSGPNGVGTWTELWNADENALSTAIYYKVADGTEDGATANFTHSSGSRNYNSCCYRLTGAGTPYLTEASGYVSTTSGSWSANTPQDSNSGHVFLYWAAIDSDPVTIDTDNTSGGLAENNNTAVDTIYGQDTNSTAGGSSATASYSWSADTYHQCMVEVPGE